MRINVPPAAFGATVAQAIQHLGATEEQAGNELFNRAIAIQQLRNESEATEALANYELTSGKLRNDFLLKQGKDAPDALEASTQSQNEARIAAREDLSNDFVRKMFDRSSLFIQNRNIISMSDHAATETRKYAANSLQAKLNSGVDQARYATDDADFNQRLKEIDAVSRGLSAQAGHDPDSADQASFTWQSKAIGNRIIETAHKNPPLANEMFNKAVEDKKLHSSDYTRVENAVNTELNNTGARNIANRIMERVADPDRFLQSRAPGSRVEGLTPNFSGRLTQALTDAELATGERAKIESLKRTTAEQAKIYEEHKLMAGGIAAHPAAAPGTSRHEFGNAADISSGKVLDWLHKNADKYGLEFLPGKTGVNDPGHIQLKGDAPDLPPTKTATLSERQVINLAKEEAEKQAPGNTRFSDSAVAHAVNVYRMNKQAIQDERNSNIATVWDEIGGDSPPKTLDELRTRSPDISAAYEALPGKDKVAVEKAIASANRVGAQKTDITEYRRLDGMWRDPGQIEDFLNEDIASSKLLAPGAQQYFIRKQGEVRQKALSDAHVSYAMGPNGIGPMITETMRRDKDLMNILRGTMAGEIQNFQKVENRPPNAKELKEIGQRLLYGNDGPSTPFMELQEGSTRLGSGAPMFRFNFFSKRPDRLIDVQVPDEERDKIISETPGGLVPTDTDIKIIYLGEQMRKLYPTKKKETP